MTGLEFLQYAVDMIGAGFLVGLTWALFFSFAKF
jgi:hypothetical protein